jgi:hypothetical protein
VGRVGREGKGEEMGRGRGKGVREGRGKGGRGDREEGRVISCFELWPT